MRANQIISSFLLDNGFKAPEVEIYSYLLQNSPATGYKIAKGLGRSFANTYKSLESILSKGAVLVEVGKNKRFRAVPVVELLNQLESRFQSERKNVELAANELQIDQDEYRIYYLVTVEQVIERFKRMLEGCAERALIEISPSPCELLRNAIETEAKQGIRSISVRLYDNAELTGVRNLHSAFGGASIESLGAEWLALFVDGRQFMVASLTRGCGDVVEAIWSANAYLARGVYSYVNSDFHHYAFAALLDSADSVEELRAEYKNIEREFPPGGDLGFRDLRGRIRRDTGEKE